MATKKTENIDKTPASTTAGVEVPPPVSSMNVWERLLNVRSEFAEATIKKSGVNPHAEFMYFELEDIVPVARPLFTKYRLLLQMCFQDSMAYAAVVNVDDPDKTINFSIPLVFIEQPAKYRMNETQGAGAVVTYYRRYLYMLVLDLVQNDEIDGEPQPKEKPKGEDKPKKRGRPASQEQRKEIKDALVQDENAPASEQQIADLKIGLKKLLAVDESQEDFVHSVAVKTEGFTKITANVCNDLISGIQAMLANYPAQEETDG